MRFSLCDTDTFPILSSASLTVELAQASNVTGTCIKALLSSLELSLWSPHNPAGVSFNSRMRQRSSRGFSLWLLDWHKLQAKFTAQKRNLETVFLPFLLGKLNQEIPLILAGTKLAAPLSS